MNGPDTSFKCSNPSTSKRPNTASTGRHNNHAKVCSTNGEMKYHFFIETFTNTSS